MKTLVLLIPALLTFGCSKGEKEEAPPPEEKPEEKKSNVVKIQLPVPPGQHVTCEELIPDAAVFSEAIGDEVGEIRDRSNSNSEATAVCAMIRGGEPPKQNMDPKTLEEKYAKVGVLPGDEYCTVTAYCSIATDNDKLKDKCEQDGNRMSNEVGPPACVRETQRAAEYAYTYKVVEPDTGCQLEIMGGPSVVDEMLVQACTRAALESVTKAGIANPK